MSITSKASVPAISIEQKTVSPNPRSTVGTVTEIYDYLRLLFARAGMQFCYKCGRPVQKQTTDQIIDSLLKLPEGTRVQILAPVVRGRKGHYRELFEEILRDGFLRVRIDGVVREIEKGMQADRYKVHDIEIVVDRIVVKREARARIADSVEVALRFGRGVLIAHVADNGLTLSGDAAKKSARAKKKAATQNGSSGSRESSGGDRLYSSHLACPTCSISYEDPAPNSFSFNSPYGACPTCNGLGEVKEFDLSLIIPDDDTYDQRGGDRAVRQAPPDLDVQPDQGGGEEVRVRFRHAAEEAVKARQGSAAQRRRRREIRD